MTAIPNDKKLTVEEYFKLTADWEERTELIDGEIVYLDREPDGKIRAQAQPSRKHQLIAGRLFSAFDGFIKSNSGKCEANQSIDVKLGDDANVVPDVLVVCDPSKLDDHGCNGAPDLVIEITSTNRENDFDRKLLLYRKYGVHEYWIVDTKNFKVYVYDFDQHPNVVEFYDWTDEIPVRIYGGKLKIRIADLV